ncbi:MAG: CDP-alcohol phosphatidyltransferase family protein [bacterium]|nr:CDP-alcohol phosphatidyltransferase family protein [bacterium]
MFKGKFLTPSNLLSLARVPLLIPIAMALSANTARGNLWGLFFMLLAIITDYLDGFLARKLNQVSDLGKTLDPVADKICIIGVCLILSSPLRDNPIPIWLLIALVIRDTAILICGYLIYYRTARVVTSNIWGKSTSCVLALMIISYVLNLEPSNLALSWMHYHVLLWLAFTFTIVSTASYARVFYLSYVERRGVYSSRILDTSRAQGSSRNSREN